MAIYTKGGDQGRTSLLGNSRVSKTDERIELVGTIDELNSQIGLAKVLVRPCLKEELEQIQRTLIQLMSGVAATSAIQYKIPEDAIRTLEESIDKKEAAFPRPKEFVLYGGCEISARLDVARAVARRAERQFCRCLKYFPLDQQALKYLNRLADFLYVCARYADYLTKNNESDKIHQEVVKNILKNS